MRRGTGRPVPPFRANQPPGRRAAGRATQPRRSRASASGFWLAGLLVLVAVGAGLLGAAPSGSSSPAAEVAVGPPATPVPTAPAAPQGADTPVGAAAADVLLGPNGEPLWD